MLSSSLIFSSFEKNAIVASFLGALTIGHVDKKRGSLCFEESKQITIVTHKFEHFKESLCTLGKNIANKKNNNIALEISDKEEISVCGNKILKKIDNKVIYEIVFDATTYMNFLRSLTNVCLFVAYPSEIQHYSFLEFSASVEDTTTKRIEHATEMTAKKYKLTENDEDTFFIRQNLIININVIQFYADISRLLFVQK